MKKYFQLKLKVLAKMIIAKYKPKIVGVTGSVGKTTTKEAIYTVLSSKFRVRKSIKNYNNEIGVPLSIIDCQVPSKSLWAWTKVFAKALKLILIKDKNFPEILVLEMGVDRPGDMEYLTKIVQCDVGVVTSVGPSHFEYFDSIDKIKKEKSVLIKNLKEGGYAILNYDDPKVREMSEISTSRIITYGFEQGSFVKAQNLIFSFEENQNIEGLSGISFKLNYDGSVVPVKLPRAIGYPAIYSSLAAASVGIAFKMNLVDISSALSGFYLPPGRMNVIKGIKHTLIIDDTYNASPQSSLSALDFIERIAVNPGNKKWGAFGDMLELGRYTEKGHEEVGKALVSKGINKLVTVGERAWSIGKGAEDAGMRKEDIFHFSDLGEAGRFIQGRIEKGDLIFVKGSQGARMEKIVKELMADPINAKNLLVRQEKEWLD